MVDKTKKEPRKVSVFSFHNEVIDATQQPKPRLIRRVAGNLISGFQDRRVKSVGRQIGGGLVSVNRYIHKPETQKTLGQLSQMGYNAQSSGSNLSGLLMGYPERTPQKPAHKKHGKRVTITVE